MELSTQPFMTLILMIAVISASVVGAYLFWPL